MTAPLDFHGVLTGLAVSSVETPYQQLKLMKFSAFEAFLRKRDCGFDLHDWWRIGVLRPAVIDGPVDDELVASGIFDVDWPTADHRHFADGRPMPARLADIEGFQLPVWELDSQAWFHPFQLWQAYFLRRHLNSLTLSPGIVLGPEERYMEICAQKRASDQLSIEHLMRRWDYVDSFRLVDFAIAVAPLVLFRISGQILSDISRGESYDEFWRWRSSHDADSFLAKNGVCHEDLRRWNEGLSHAAYGLDPLRGWFHLTRHVAWKSWQGVQGKVLLVHDLYVLAEVIRRYAEEFLAVQLPEEDELSHGPYVREIKQRQYGYPRASERRREVRRRIAREFGLDGDVRLVWIVEGDTEEGFVDEYGKLLGVTADAVGMTIFNIKGESNVGSSQVRQRLLEARREDQFVYVTLDRNDSLRPTLRVLCDDSLITAGWEMWDCDFEGDNYTDEELAELVLTRADEEGVSISIDGAAVKNERTRASSTEGAINACLKGQHYKLKKDALWGRKLARWALERSAPPDAAKEGDRAVTTRFTHLLRACSAEFLGSVERYRVDGTTGKIVAKAE